jgi:hypothetical protein
MAAWMSLAAIARKILVKWCVVHARKYVYPRENIEDRLHHSAQIGLPQPAQIGVETAVGALSASVISLA